jgi:hypothetical protein
MCYGLLLQRLILCGKSGRVYGNKKSVRRAAYRVPTLKDVLSARLSIPPRVQGQFFNHLSHKRFNLLRKECRHAD